MLHDAWFVINRRYRSQGLKDVDNEIVRDNARKCASEFRADDSTPAGKAESFKGSLNLRQVEWGGGWGRGT